MVVKKRIGISVILASILQVGALALTLEDASKDVFNSNPDIKQRLENYRDTKHDYEISKSGFLPKVDLSAMTGRERYKSNMLDMPSLNTDTTLATKSLGATLNENIFNGFANYYDLQSQKTRVLSAEQFLKEKSNEILLNLTEYYINVIRKYEQLEIEKDNVAAHKKTYEKVKERKEAGYSTISELWQAESRYVLAQSNLVSAELGYQDAVANFAKVYGKGVSGKELKKPDFDMTLPEDLDKAMAVAMKENATIITEQYNIDALKSQYKGSYSSFLPKADFVLSASRSDNSAGLRGYIESYSGSLNLSYNIFNGFADMEKTRKYIAEVNSQAANIESVKLQVAEKLRLAWDSYSLVSRQLEFLRQHSELSKKTAEAYQEEFMLGRRTIIDLLDAEAENNSARRELVGAEYDMLYAKFRIYDAMYGLTDALVRRDDSTDSDMKSVLFQKLSPDAMDSDRRVQMALEKHKKAEEDKAKQVAAVAPVAKEAPPVISTEAPVSPSVQAKVATGEQVAADTVKKEVTSYDTTKSEPLQINDAPDIEDEPAAKPIEQVKAEEPKEQVADIKQIKNEKTIDTSTQEASGEPKEPVAPQEQKVEPTKQSSGKEQSVAAPDTTCYRVTTDKLNTRAAPQANAKKVGYLLKNWRACSDINQNGWIKLPNGWANTEYMTPLK